MKNLWTVFIGILILVSPAYAHMGLSVDDMMNSMMVSQNVNNISQLDCNKATDQELEELGDAVMDKMMNNEQLHEQMDNMMGGEGSASLQQMHVAMGKGWLNCGGSQMVMMPMMQMMGMMGQGYFNSSNSQLPLTLSIISLIAVIIGGFVIFSKLNDLEKKLNRRK